MKFVKDIIIALIALTLLSSWGFYAHFRVNRVAVFTLPRAMSGFYQANIEYLTEHAISADRRRYVDSAEIPRHFFDADHYGKDPFHTVPQKWNDAIAKYSADTLYKYGTLPWTIQYNYYRLVDAFKNHDTSAIKHYSAYLGHYVADACVPLHTTMNHDGQLTHQDGLHALWESRLPEQFGNSYNYNAGKAKYLENPLWQAFILCRSSFKCTDSVLRIQQQVDKTFPADKKYEVIMRGKRKIKDFSAAYCRAYHTALKGMVQRRLRTAILNVGSYWYSAWVDAGQPDLNQITEPLPDSLKQKTAHEAALYKLGKIAALPNYGTVNKPLPKQQTQLRSTGKPTP